MQVTFHRAIDVSREPLTVVDQCVEFGVDRILTSGAAASALGGARTNLGDFGRLERTKIASGSASGALERARIVSGRPSRRLERAKIDSGGPSGRLERPNIALGQRFWSIWRVRRVDFGNFSTLFRSSRPTRSNKRRLMKNLQKPMVFTSFS